MEELRAGCRALLAADLDGDGRAELLAAGKPHLLALELDDAGAAQSVVLDAVGEDLDGLAHADLDGDGLGDLVYLHHDAEFPVRYRPGRAGGTFGLRLDAELPPCRDTAVADLDGDGRAEVLAIFRDSGRISVLAVAEGQAAAAGGPPGGPPGARALERLALRPIEGRDDGRSFFLGDLDGDGAAEIVAAEPDVAEVLVLRARRRELSARTFPNLVGVTQPRIGDVDGDGARELVTISGPERMLGVARPAADASLPFPETLPIDGTPHALDLADLDGDGADDVVLLSSSGAGRERRFQVEVRRGSPAGPAREPEVSAITLKQAPSAIALFDLDQDGAQDLLLFECGDEDLPVLALGRGMAFELDPRGAALPGLGILAGASARSVSRGDLDGDGRDELLAAAENFSRALRFTRGADGHVAPVVLAQFNGPSPSAAISACLLVELDGAPPAELVLHEQNERELLVLDRQSEPPRLRERIEAGRLDPELFGAADLDGDGRADLVLMDQGEVAVLFADGARAALEPRAAYDPELETTYLDTLAVGDLNADGRLDVLAVEGFEHRLLILSEHGGLARRLEFRVFEQGALEEGRSSEPRELVCTDLDGDGATDVAALVHDKLIAYIQDPIP